MTDVSDEWRGDYLALRYPFALHCADSEFRSLASEMLVDLAADRDDAASVYDVRRGAGELDVRIDGADLVTAASPAKALAWITWHVNRAAVASCQDCVVLHASASVIDGMTVLAAGDSGAGKSTLGAALVRAGAHYITDEAAAIDPSSLEVLPFPKPVSLHSGSWGLLPATMIRPTDDEPALVPASAIGAVVDGRSPRPSYLLAVRHQPGEGSALRPISRAEMLFRLAGLTFWFTAAVIRNLRCLAAIVAEAHCAVLATDEIETSVTDLRESLRESGPPAEAAKVTVCETEELVAVEIDAEAVVFVHATGSLHHLDPLAFCLWDTMRAGGSVGELVDELSAVYTAPRSLISSDVERLASQFIDNGLVPK